MAVGREAGRQRAGAFRVVAEHDRTEHHAVLGVGAPVEGPGLHAEEPCGFLDVTSIRLRDVHHVAGPVLRLRAACALVPGDAEHDALLDARELLRALEGAGERREALSGELALAALHEPGAVGVHGVDERELGGDADGGRRVDDVLHDLVEHEAQQDHEGGERHEAPEVAEGHLQHLLLSFGQVEGFSAGSSPRIPDA